MGYDDYNEDEEQQSFFQRNRIAVIVGAVVLLAVIGGVIYKLNNGGSSSSSHSTPTVVMIKLPPPPPPPPKPVPQQPKPEETPRQDEQKMVDKEPEEAPKDEAPKEAPAPNLDLASAVAGPGDSGMTVGAGTSRGLFGLSNGQGGDGPGEIGGNGKDRHGGKGHGQWEAYASSVKEQIKSVLKEHPKTRNAFLNLEIRLWWDVNGIIQRVAISDSSDDSAVDDAIKNEILAGLKLQQPPLKGAPTTITLRVTPMK